MPIGSVHGYSGRVVEEAAAQDLRVGVGPERLDDVAEQLLKGILVTCRVAKGDIGRDPSRRCAETFAGQLGLSSLLGLREGVGFLAANELVATVLVIHRSA